MQETEIKNNLILSKLSVPGFDIELENNSRCSKAGIWYKVYEVIQIWREHYNRWHHWVKDNRLYIINMSNRFWYLNDKIPLDFLNNSFETFKIKWKNYLSTIKHHVTMLLLKLAFATMSVLLWLLWQDYFLIVNSFTLK